MDTGERWKALLEAVETHGYISVAKLAKQLSVSEMTIRRDLSQLEERGQIRRVHGGASKASSASQEPPFESRAAVSVEEKKAIAALAADLVMDGDTIALDVGSTALELAKGLTGRRNLTVVTANLHIAALFLSYPNIKVILAGGTLRPNEGSLIGPLTRRILEGLYVNKFFLGVGGLEEKAGFTEYSLEDVEVKKIMARNAESTIALVDSTKFGRICLNKVCEFSEINTVVTVPGLPGEIRSRLEEADIEVIQHSEKTK